LEPITQVPRATAPPADLDALWLAHIVAYGCCGRNHLCLPGTVLRWVQRLQRLQSMLCQRKL